MALVSDTPDIPDDVDHFSIDKLNAELAENGLKPIEYYKRPDPNPDPKPRGRVLGEPPAIPVVPFTQEQLTQPPPPNIQYPTTVEFTIDDLDFVPAQTETTPPADNRPIWQFSLPGAMG